MRLSTVSVLFILLFLALPVQPSKASDTLPRFASLASNEVNIRSGPGKNYPIQWVYERKGYPVEIDREFEGWRRVTMIDGTRGWVFRGLISSMRTVLIEADENVPIRRTLEPESRIIAFAEPNAILYLDHCRDSVCRVEAGRIAGWIPEKFLWGLYDHEK